MLNAHVFASRQDERIVASVVIGAVTASVEHQGVVEEWSEFILGVGQTLQQVVELLNQETVVGGPVLVVLRSSWACHNCQETDDAAPGCVLG